MLVKKIIIIVGVSMFIGGSFFGGYYLWKTQKLSEDDQVVYDLGEIIILPQDEIPTVASVSDATQLGSGAFLEQAENGDKIIFYVKAGKAYLFRPQEKIIVDIATINSVNEPTVFQVSE